VQCAKELQVGLDRYMRVTFSALWILPALLSAGCAHPAMTSRSSVKSWAWFSASGLASGRGLSHVETNRSGSSVAWTGSRVVTSGSRSGQAAVSTPIPFPFEGEPGQPIARQVSHRTDTLPPYPQPILRSATTPKIGSPEWEREQAENERRERYIRHVLQNICRGC
jgi:hypothetical protein